MSAYTPVQLFEDVATASADVVFWVSAAIAAAMGVMFAFVGIRKAIAWAASMVGGSHSSMDDPVDRSGWTDDDHFLWDRFQEYRANFDDETAWANAEDDLDYRNSGDYQRDLDDLHGRM